MSLRLLRGFTLYINDTTNLFFEIDTMKLAAKGEKTETFQPGGGDLELEVSGLGIKALEVPFKTKAHTPEVMGYFGGPPGVRQSFTGKKYIVDEKDGTEHEHAVDMKGRLTSVEDEEMQGGKAAGFDNKIGSITRYTELWDGREMHRFDFFAGGWQIWNFQPINETRRRILFS